MLPLSDVESCVIERRDAFASFAPYEPLDEPLCVTTSDNEIPTLSGIPANSDLTITVSKPGYLPAVMSHRVLNTDLLYDVNVSFLATVLLTEQQGELFVPALEPTDSSASAGKTNAGQKNTERGWMTIEVSIQQLGFSSPTSGGESLSTGLPVFLAAHDANVSLSSELDATTQDFVLSGTQHLLELPAAIYRAQVTHPRAAPCEPLGLPVSSLMWGLSTDTAGEIELRVLPGHVSALSSVCACAPPSLDSVVVDGPACLFE
jgi:hypothetical protein